MTSRLFSFVGGTTGDWQVARMETVIGTALPPVNHLDIVANNIDSAADTVSWVLRGVTSHARYVNRDEHQQLVNLQAGLDRPQATCAALIPVKKSAAWWMLAQDERRAILEERSHHIQIGMQYLPAIARRLHHSYDLGEPFDFLTWFEYAPDDAEAFEQLLRTLRDTEEWQYIEREIDIRLTKY